MEKSDISRIWEKIERLADSVSRLEEQVKHLLDFTTAQSGKYVRIDMCEIINRQVQNDIEEIVKKSDKSRSWWLGLIAGIILMLVNLIFLWVKGEL